MLAISIPMAATLTGLSERTLWRRVSEGGVRRGPSEANRATVVLDDVAAMMALPLSADDARILVEADCGNADALNTIAILCLEANRQREAARLLDQAAQKGHADSMALLGRCYIEGAGVEQDSATGLAWINRAAAAGHVLSKAIVDRMVAGAIKSTS